MASGVYVGMTGATARLHQLDAISDNLANSTTPGFRATRPVFEAVLAEQGSDKHMTSVVGAGVDLRPGAVMNTERPLDLRPANDMYFGVRMSDGDIAFTRDGRILVEPTGRLTVGGRPVVNESGQEISIPPDTRLSFDERGQVLVDDQPADTLGLFQLSGRVDRVGPALLRPLQEDGANRVEPQQRSVKVGELDGSNYPALEATLALVSAQRAYDASMQSIQVYKRLDELANGVGKPRG